VPRLEKAQVKTPKFVVVANMLENKSAPFVERSGHKPEDLDPIRCAMETPMLPPASTDAVSAAFSKGGRAI
jgi:hypothetical protein